MGFRGGRRVGQQKGRKHAVPSEWLLGYMVKKWKRIQGSCRSFRPPPPEVKTRAGGGVRGLRGGSGLLLRCRCRGADLLLHWLWLYWETLSVLQSMSQRWREKLPLSGPLLRLSNTLRPFFSRWPGGVITRRTELRSPFRCVLSQLMQRKMLGIIFKLLNLK